MAGQFSARVSGALQRTFRGSRRGPMVHAPWCAPCAPRAKPKGRRARVEAIVDWLDRSSGRGRKKINDREEMLNSFREGPGQRMMREMREKAMKDQKSEL